MLIARMINSEKEPIDDHWSAVFSEIGLPHNIPEAVLTGIEEFSHIEIIFYFDKTDASKISFAGHPGKQQLSKHGHFYSKKKRETQC